MSEHDEIIDRLEARGAAEPPPPSDGLRSRLTGEHLTRPVALRPRPFITLGVGLPSAAVAAAILGFILVTFGGSGGGSQTFVVREASNSSVSLGEELHDGDPVDIDPGGLVTIAGRSFGPGSYVFRDGRLVPLGEPATSTSTSSSTSTSVVPTTTTVLSTTTTTPTTVPSTGTTVRPGPGGGGVPIAIRLDGIRSAQGIVGLRWTRYEGADFGAYVVHRATATIFRTPDPDHVQFGDRTPPAEPVGYVVVVMDADRHVVARSNVVRI